MGVACPDIFIFLFFKFIKNCIRYIYLLRLASVTQIKTRASQLAVLMSCAQLRSQISISMLTVRTSYTLLSSEAPTVTGASFQA